MATDLSGAPDRTGEHTGAPGGRWRPTSRRRLPRWAGPVALLVVLTAALLVGSGAFSGGRQSASSRVGALEAVVKCPSCEDLSVAQSSAPTAIAVRREIAHMVASGASDQQVQAALVAQYGTTILLRPRASGLGLVVYLLPAAAGAAAVGALGVLFWRRSAEMRRLRDGT